MDEILDYVVEGNNNSDPRSWKLSKMPPPPPGRRGTRSNGVGKCTVVEDFARYSVKAVQDAAAAAGKEGDKEGRRRLGGGGQGKKTAAGESSSICYSTRRTNNKWAWCWREYQECSASHTHVVRSEEPSLQEGGLHAEHHPHIMLGEFKSSGALGGMHTHPGGGCSISLFRFSTSLII